MHMESTLDGRFTRHDLSSAQAGGTSGRAGDEVDSGHLQGRLASILAENRELRADLEAVRAEKAQMAEVLAKLVEVIGSKSADRLVHDVRNVLNERELYRALADSAM